MILDELGSFAQAQGLGQLSTSLFKSSVPIDAEDAVMVLVEVPGQGPMYVHNDAAPSIEQAMVQVIVRGAPGGYAAARSRAQEAFVAFGSVHNQDLSGTPYLSIMPLQSPFALPLDEENRPRLVFTMRCVKACL